MSMEEIKEGIENIAGGVKSELEKIPKIKTPFVKYGGPCIKVPKIPTIKPLKPMKPSEKPESSVEPLAPAQPLNLEKEENK